MEKQRIHMFLIVILAGMNFSFGQSNNSAARLEIILLNENITTHFVGKEDISYTDISTHRVGHYLPLSNMLAVKPKEKTDEELGVLTIISESRIQQYKLQYTPIPEQAFTEVFFNEEGRVYNNPNVGLTTQQIKQISDQIRKESPKYHGVSTRAYKMEISLNNIYTVENYFFIDYTIENKTNIKYDVDQIRYKIEDEKVAKKTNAQSIEIEEEPMSPLYNHFAEKSFKKKMRNIAVFEKFTFPDDKVFTIEIAEEQISGRKIMLRINYNDVLKADTIDYEML